MSAPTNGERLCTHGSDEETLRDTSHRASYELRYGTEPDEALNVCGRHMGLYLVKMTRRMPVLVTHIKQPGRKP